MDKSFLHDGKLFRIEIQPQTSGFFTGISDESESQLEVESFEIQGDTFRIKTATGEYEGTYHAEDSNYFLHMNGRTFRFKEDNGQAGHDDSEGMYRSPMPGKVVSVSVKVGEQVSTGDALTVVEAMKMENTIRSEIDGTVTRVSCAAGDLITPEMVLVEIEPDAK